MGRQYIRNTFAAAKQNISINGMDTEEVERHEIGEGKPSTPTVP